MAKATPSKTTKKAPVAKQTGVSAGYRTVSIVAIIALICAVSYALFLFFRLEDQTAQTAQLQEQIIELRRELDDIDVTNEAIN